MLLRSATTVFMGFDARGHLPSDTVVLARREGRGIELGDAAATSSQADRLRHEDIVSRLRYSAHAYLIAMGVERGQRP